jgi:hypothetical protein
MKNMLLLSSLLTLMIISTGNAQSEKTIPVTADNFCRAETDYYFNMFVKRGALGKFYHSRELPPIDLPSVRPNRDTYYSEAVFDLDAGPVTITLPNAGKRFISLLTINEDHYVYNVVYLPGKYTFTKKQIGTRYLFAAVRILVNPTDKADNQIVHDLQDGLKIDQKSIGKFEIPNWDTNSQKLVRNALLELNKTLPDLRNAGGRKDEVDPVRHLIGTASGWGLNPDKDAIYLNITPQNNDGTGIYKLTVKNVPVDGFWSISVYDEKGHFVQNEYDAYTVNNITGSKNPDGSITIQFGGCTNKTGNCLPIMNEWNYMVRLYRPNAEVLNGSWKFPSVEKLN